MRPGTSTDSSAGAFHWRGGDFALDLQARHEVFHFRLLSRPL
jgi:hypothetical protein